jgi:hypothetical protein
MVNTEVDESADRGEKKRAASGTGSRNASASGARV